MKTHTKDVILRFFLWLFTGILFVILTELYRSNMTWQEMWQEDWLYLVLLPFLAAGWMCLRSFGEEPFWRRKKKPEENREGENGSDA